MLHSVQTGEKEVTRFVWEFNLIYNFHSVTGSIQIKQLSYSIFKLGFQRKATGTSQYFHFEYHLCVLSLTSLTKLVNCTCLCCKDHLKIQTSTWEILLSSTKSTQIKQNKNKSFSEKTCSFQDFVSHNYWNISFNNRGKILTSRLFILTSNSSFQDHRHLPYIHLRFSQLLNPTLSTRVFVNSTQWIQGKVANLKRMVSDHCTTSLEHVIKMSASNFDTDYASQLKLTTIPLIHCLEFTINNRIRILLGY